MEIWALSRMMLKCVQEIGVCFNAKRLFDHEVVASLRCLYQADTPLAEDKRELVVSPLSP